MTEDDLARLYSEHGYVVLRRCVAYLGDVARAQDVLQEVFVRVLRSADGLRGEPNPRTWLCRIADRLCIDILQRERRGVLEPLAAEGSGQSERACDIESALFGDDGDALRTVCRLMPLLDAQGQRLAVLCFVDELTQDEIAAELGWSRRAAGKRVHALRERARELVSKGYG